MSEYSILIVSLFPVGGGFIRPETDGLDESSPYKLLIIHYLIMGRHKVCPTHYIYYYFFNQPTNPLRFTLNAIRLFYYPLSGRMQYAPTFFLFYFLYYILLLVNILFWLLVADSWILSLPSFTIYLILDTVLFNQQIP